MKVNSPFVVLSFSKEGILGFLNRYSVSRSLSESASELDDVFLINAKGNSAFVSLKQKVGNNSAGLIELKFIDVDSSFERAFFDNSIDKLLTVTDDLDVSKNLTVDVKDTLFVQNGEVVGAGFTVIDDPTNLNEQATINEGTNFLKKIKDRGIDNNFYILFGTGTEPEYWGGPYQVKLVSTQVDLSNSKMLTLGLQPILRQLLSRNRANLLGKVGSSADDKDQTVEYVGKSDIIDIRRFNEPYYKSSYLESVGLEAGLDGSLSKFFQQKADPALLSFLTKVDFHTLVTDVIRDYIKKVTGSNRVIVLLPNLNEILSDYIREVAEINISSLLDEPILVDSKFILLEQLRLLLSGLGIDTDVIYQNGSLRTKPVVPGAATILGMPSYLFDDDNPPKNVSEYLERYQDYYFYISSIRSKASDFNVEGPLETIISKVNKETQNIFPVNFYIHYENNPKIIDYWTSGDLDDHPMFRSLAKTSEDPVVIFGDAGAIKSYLMGEVSQEVKSSLLPDIPLHPSDKGALLNLSYNRTIRTLNKYSLPDSPNFNSLYDTDFDSFSIIGSLAESESDQDIVSNFSEVFKELTKINNIPTFRYNVKNPNVAKVKYTSNPVYFAQLQRRYQKDISRRASLAFADKMLDEYALALRNNPQFVVNYIDNRLAIDNSLSRSEVAKELAKKLFPEVNPSVFAIILDNFLNLVNKKANAPVLNMEAGSNATLETSLYEFAKQVYYLSVNSEIETLPFFHLGPQHLLSSCFLFANIPQIIASTGGQPSLLTKFLSGHYKILEIEHSLDSSRASTKLKLYKVPYQFEEEEEKSNSFDFNQ